MFIDSAKIFIRGGAGGKGCRSFYRDKYNRRGFPDGGDGGNGGDIVIIADRNLHTLLDFHFNRHFYGQKGNNGSSKNKRGKNAPDLVIRVPCGVLVKDLKTDCLLASLDTDGETLIAARGGRGGRGNRQHREASDGEICLEQEILFDLKLIADVGIIGFPNAGKSTLVAAVSHAHPKIAAYPFTTKIPILGVVHRDDDSFVIADIPGLIEGSSFGRGLGDKFLRHVERTKVLIHCIDMSGCEGRDPVGDYTIIINELKKYSQEVSRKTQIIAANKMDLENSQANLIKFKKVIKKKVWPISALHKDGLEELLAAVRKKL